MSEIMQPELLEQVLPARSIPAEIRRRMSPYLLERIAPALQTEYEAVGWVVERKLKRAVVMRRPKPHDIAFEDRVWAAMAKLNFSSMNRNRLFKLTYGPAAGEAKQIDVFAADDEVVLVIECKSSEAIRTSSFKAEVEAIQGVRPGLMRTIKKSFPDHKVKFILATNNYVVSPQGNERITGADVLYMDEDAIDYYIDLADHLGKAARFQLLGSLFAGTKIPGLEPKVPAIQGKLGGHTYYSFSIEPERLLKLSYILHRNKANSNLMPTYQRLIKKTRLRQISQFVEEGGFFPNSIILNVESGRRGLQFDRLGAGETEAKVGILHLPQTYRAAYVIDGQHRLYGYAGSERASKDLIPVVAFMDLPRSEQVRLFMQINENQQAVPKNLRNTLNADLLWESDDLREQVKALKLRIAQHLGENKASPLYGRIAIGENKKSALRCITIDAVSIGLERGNFIGSFTKGEVRDPGTFYRGSNQPTFDSLTKFLELCFSYVREGLDSQWSLGNAEGGFVFINNGVEALLRIFSDLVDHVVGELGLQPRAMSAQYVFAAMSSMLDPVINFLASLSPEEAADFRRLYGSAGRSRYWRKLQSAIKIHYPSFSPAGLDAYVTDEAKAFNTESFAMIRDIETFMNHDIRRRLQDDLGAKWFKSGVPQKVYQAASMLAIEKNRDRDADDEVEPWECLHLSDYQAILMNNNDTWKRLFEKRYTRPGDENKPGGWRERANWVAELNRIRNENSHTYSVKEEEYDFLSQLTSWLVRGDSDNDLS